MYIIVMVSTFFVLMLIGAPIFVALATPSMIYILTSGVPLSSLAYNFIYVLDKWPLVAVPLFIALGNLLTELGGARQVYSFARAVFRDKKGYSLRLNVMMSLIFAGMSGSELADIAGLGAIEIKAAESEGFEKGFASALTIGSALIGPLFPPSVPLIIYAMVAETSTVKQLLAGVFPSLVLAAILYAYVVYVAPKKLSKKNNSVQHTFQEPPRKSLLKATKDAWPILILPPLIICSMMFGVFSPTEAGAGGIGFVILIGLYYGTLKLGRLTSAALDTFITTASVMALVAVAALFTNILVQEGLAEIVANFLLEFSNNWIVILLVIDLSVLILGCFMSGLTIVLLVTPMIIPVIKQLGIDPVHLGIILIFGVGIGFLTPPFGMGLFTVSRVANVEINDVVKNSLGVMFCMIIAFLLVTIVPSISMWLPNSLFD